MPADVPVETKRKVDRGPMTPACPVYRGQDDVWQVQDYATARLVLRSTDTRQAGFGIENFERLSNKMRRPVLYRDGPAHREHRRQTCPFTGGVMTCGVPGVRATRRGGVLDLLA